MCAKKLNRLINRHFQYIENAGSVIVYFQYILFEALTVAMLTLKYQIGHELHFYSNRSLPLTFLAPATLRVKRKVRSCIAHLFG